MSQFVSKTNDKKIDTNEVARIARELGLHPKLVELLFIKDITDEKSIKDFLYPDANNFYDPFLMKNMREITARIDEAIAGNEKIVVYGDYDCDGICASAMLSLYLSGLGAEVFCHIPNREGEGYGLSNESIERIIERCQPDLIITCDCGVSGIDEVTHTLDLGVDIIVTDHHEVGERLPDCLVLNPKQPDCRYPFSQLCGAGVVFKLIEAHGGIQKAKEFLPLAAIATIADLVPLISENRLIVQLGLDYESLRKNLGIKMLLEKIELVGTVRSSDMAFKVAPRINAAGRMGDAYRSFQLLTSDNEQEIAQIIEEIEYDNNQRKELCGRLYEEALEIIYKENTITTNSVIICHPDWEKGITGIVAAKLSGDFSRPAFIMVRSGDVYKGTARSIADINVFELLSSMKELLLEFGGHSQAAGFSIAEENIPEFRQRVNKHLDAFHYESFLVKVKYDTDIDIGEVDMDFIRNIELLEPFGNSNARPLFRLKADTLKISPLKETEHLCITLSDDISAYAFGYRKQDYLFVGEGQKELILDFKLNNFKGRTKIDAYVKACVPESYHIDDDIAKAAFIKYINYPAKNDASYSEYSKEQLSELIPNNIFGTLIIAGCKQSFVEFLSHQKSKYIVLHELFTASAKNNYNRLILSPEFDENLALQSYRTIIFLDSPPSSGVISYINKKTPAKIYVPKQSTLKELLLGISLERQTFAKYYKLIKDSEQIQAADLGSYARRLAKKLEDFDMRQFIVCLTVFIDLDLVRISRAQFSIYTTKNVKADLTDSKNYNYLKEMINSFEGKISD